MSASVRTDSSLSREEQAAARLLGVDGFEMYRVPMSQEQRPPDWLFGEAPLYFYYIFESAEKRDKYFRESERTHQPGLYDPRERRRVPVGQRIHLLPSNILQVVRVSPPPFLHLGRGIYEGKAYEWMRYLSRYIHLTRYMGYGHPVETEESAE